MRDRRRRHRGDEEPEVVATTREIVAEDDTGIFDDDPDLVETRMKVVLAQLEQTELIAQEEHRVQMYPASVKVATEAEAEHKIEQQVTRRGIKRGKVPSLKAVAGLLIRTPADGNADHR